MLTNVNVNLGFVELMAIILLTGHVILFVHSFTYFVGKFISSIDKVVAAIDKVVLAINDLKINIVNESQQKTGGISSKVEKTKVQELPPEAIAPYIGRAAPSGFGFKREDAEQDTDKRET